MSGTHHIDRGYVHLAEKLSGLGADIWRIFEEKEVAAEPAKVSVSTHVEKPVLKIQPTMA
ncbi:UDP-N-acetylglucosamine 1-carboxyvinyltransferase [compost metagenome]